MTQALEAVFHQGGQRRRDYTPAADKSAGELAIENGVALVVTSPEGITAGELGSADEDGTYRFRKAAGGGVTFSDGDKIGWDLDGDAGGGGTAVASGAGTSDGDVALCIADAADGDDHVVGILNRDKLN